jgi:hypothetical protein
LLSFAYVYFFESRLFNGLQPIQIKNFPVSHGLEQNVSSAFLPSHSPLLRSAPLFGARRIGRGHSYITVDSEFCK